MNFQREPITPSLISEIRPHLYAHFKEIAHYQDIDLNPDFDSYAAAESAGLLRIFTARTTLSQKLVGYCIYFVRTNLHYRDSLQATQDILYVDKQYRGRLAGYRFIKWCDGELRKEGVQVVYQHTKKAHDFGPMLKRQGYELVDLIYAKRLDVKEPEGEG